MAGKLDWFRAAMKESGIVKVKHLSKTFTVVPTNVAQSFGWALPSKYVTIGAYLQVTAAEVTGTSKTFVVEEVNSDEPIAQGGFDTSLVGIISITNGLTTPGRVYTGPLTYRKFDDDWVEFRGTFYLAYLDLDDI